MMIIVLPAEPDGEWNEEKSAENFYASEQNG